jgi:mannitol/fructose-specific phosphotransferase system IIA component (Ntr-type)
MKPSSRTPEGEPNCCPVCGAAIVIEPSRPPGDAPCPSCGTLVWFPAKAEGSHLLALPHFKATGETIRTKRDALAAVLDHLATAKMIERTDRDALLAALLKREELGSTGIGRGIAVPHTKHPKLREHVAAVATFSQPVDFESLDGEPVHTVYVLLSPADRPGEHMRMLEAISRGARE